MWRKVFLPLSVNVINMLVTVMVNYYYISVVIAGVSDTRLIIAQLWISFFKAVWNNIYLPGAMVLLRRNNTPKNHLFIHYTFMSIFNNILIPALVTIFSDSSCLNGLIVGEDVISASYVSKTANYNFGIQANIKSYAILSFNTPTLLSNVTSKYFESSLTPAWSYSYLCSSTLIQAYAPIYLYSYTIYGIIFPVFNYILIYAAACGYSNWILKKVNNVFFESTVWSNTISDDLKLVTNIDLSSRRIDELHQSNISLMHQTIIRMRPLFLGTSVIGHIFLHFSVLLTFGLTTPWLAIVVCITILNEALIWRLIIGRYLMKVEELGGKNDVINYARLEEACRINPNAIKLCLFFVLIVCCLFWACMIFDPIADKYSDDIALDLSIVVALLLIFMSFLLVYSDDVGVFASEMNFRFKNGTTNATTTYNEVSINPILVGEPVNRITTSDMKSSRSATRITLSPTTWFRSKREELFVNNVDLSL